MPKNIFQLALDFYRSPTEFGDLVDVHKSVPQGIGDLLAFLAGPDQERVRIIGNNVSLQGAGELFDAASYFVEEVLFVPGADYYRLLGVRTDASADVVRQHYQYLIGLFYQDERSSMVNWKESDSMRVNQAYSVLRDLEKRRNYNVKLAATGRQIEQFDPTTYKKQERTRQKPLETHNENTVIARSADTDVLGSGKVKREAEQVLADAVRLASNHVSAKSDVIPAVKTVSAHAPRTAASADDLPKILICDDSATVRASLAKALSNDFRCLRARNGDEGWRILQDNPDVKLVLTDLEMPEMDGYALITKIRASDRPNLANIPIIIVTSASDTKAKQLALGKGASDFLAKGTDYVEILARVRVHYRLAKSTELIPESVPTVHTRSSVAAPDDEEKTVFLDLSKTRMPIDARDRDPSARRGGVEKSAWLPKPVLIGAMSLVVVVVLALMFSSGNKEAPETSAQVAGSPANGAPGDEVAPSAATAPAEDTNQLTVLDVVKPDTAAGAQPVESAHSTTKPLVSVVSKTASREVSTNKPSKDNAALVDRSAEQRRKESSFRKNNLADATEIIPTVVTDVPANSAPGTDAAGEPQDPEETQKIKQRLAEIEAESMAMAVRNEQPANDEFDALAPSTQVAAKGDAPIGSGVGSGVNAISAMGSAVTPSVGAANAVASVAPEGVADPFNTTIPAEDDGDGKQVAMAEPAKPVMRDLISSTELSILLFKFVRAYEEGNLFQFLGLFDPDARTEDRVGIREIRKDYELLFKKSDVRQFIIQDMNWTKEGIRAVGKGKFEVKIKAQGSDKMNAYSGTVTFHVVKRADEIFVTQLFHSYAQQ